MKTLAHFVLLTKTKDDVSIGRQNFDVEVEFIAGKQLLADVNNIASEIIEEKLYQLDIEFAEIHSSGKKTRVNFHLPITLELSTTVFGTVTERKAIFDENTIAELEKVKPKPLNAEQLQNDIRYIDNLLASESPIIEVRQFIYYVLNRHFDVPIPESMKLDQAESKPVEDSSTVRS